MADTSTSGWFNLLDLDEDKSIVAPTTTQGSRYSTNSQGIMSSDVRKMQDTKADSAPTDVLTAIVNKIINGFSGDTEDLTDRPVAGRDVANDVYKEYDKLVGVDSNILSDAGKLFMDATDPSAPAPASEDPDRKFYQSGIPIEDRVFKDADEPDLSDLQRMDPEGIKDMPPLPKAATEFPARISMGLMSNPDNVDAVEGYRSDVKKQTNAFFLDIGEKAESDHGSTPKLTTDSREASLADSDKSMDIGFGHKIIRGGIEDTSGMIHGIKYKKTDGTYIALTKKQKVKILNEDMAVNLVAARKDYTKVDGSVAKGWDSKLKDLGTSWDDLDFRYQNALTSLAYNVGGKKAATQWKAVLKAAKEKNVASFAKELRREDGGSKTEGMDNRVAKELYYSGLIKGLSELDLVWTEKVNGVNVTRSHALPLVTDDSGIPN